MKRILIKLGVALIILSMLLCLFSCDMLLGGTGSNSDKNTDTSNTKDDGKDEYGFYRPKNCWYSDSLIINSYPDMSDLFGDKGKSGILSEYAIERDGSNIYVGSRYNTIKNYLVCLIYGDIGSGSFNVTTNLKFTLVNGTQILYDGECVEVGSPVIYAVEGSYDISIDMSKPLDGRVSITGEPNGSVVQAMAVIPFELLVEGTLYADFKVDCPSMSSSSNYYVESYNVASTEREITPSTTVKVDSFTTSYLTEEKYNMGDFTDDALSSKPDFNEGTTNYMVVDFSYSSVENNDGNKSIHILVRVPEDTVMDATIEEAPTGKIEESIMNGITSIYASYSVLETAGELKTVRMIVRLKPLNEGIANVDIFLMGDEDGEVATTGEIYATAKLVSGVPSIRYTLNKDKKSYTASSLWQSSLTEAIIPDTYMDLPVTAIANGLFTGNTMIRRVTIGNNITSLSSGAFQNCTSLEEITLGSQITSLPTSLFSGCTSLKSVTLPEGSASIANECFLNCSSLRTVNGIENVTQIGKSAFSGCTSLVNFEAPLLNEINATAFSGCKSLTSLTFDSLTKIGSSAFANCTGLNSLSSSSLSEIGDNAFFGCSSLTAITLSNVEVINKSTFEKCTSLPWQDLSNIIRIYERAFYDCKAFDRIIIPDGCVRVEDEAFAGTSGVRSIHIGAIVNFDGLNVGEVFDKSSLETITSSGENTRFKVENNCLIREYESATNGELIRSLYLGCKNSIIPEDVRYIYDYAFSGCQSLTSVTIPSSVHEINRYAFRDCKNLKEVKFSSTINMIWSYAFQGCDSLAKVVLPTGRWYAAGGPGKNYVGEKITISSYEEFAEVLTKTYVSQYIMPYTGW